MDSSTEQLHRWAAHKFDTTFENVKRVDFDTHTRLVGCETCGDYETTTEVDVWLNDGSFRSADFDSVYALIAEVTQEYPA